MYKGQLFAWIIADIVKIVGLCFVWMASAKLTGNVDQNYVVTYYILLMLVSKFTTDLTPEIGVRNILSGKFSNLLMKPFPYMTEYLATNIGGNILRIVIFVPAFVLSIFVARYLGVWSFDFSPYLIFLSCIAIFIGFFVNFLLGNIFTLIAFYIKYMDGMRIFYYNIAAFLSGEYIPFVFLSTIPLYFVQILPFRYTLSFPVEILMGRLSNYEIQQGFIFGCVWLVVLFVLFKIFKSISIRKYAAEGI